MGWKISGPQGAVTLPYTDDYEVDRTITVTGNSVTDIVCLSQGTDAVCLHTSQVQDLYQQLLHLGVIHKEPLNPVYVLMTDGDGTMRSTDKPFGVAVTSKEEAEKYVDEGGVGCTHSYRVIHIFHNKDSAINHVYPRNKP